MKRNKKIVMKTTFVVLCMVITVNSGITVFAADNDVTKDENVYVNLNQDGSVSGIYVVNEYTLEQAGKIIDYGNYSSVKNLTTDQKIEISGNQISTDAPEGKFYYQGNMNTKDMPWNIKISYWLDGKAIDAEKLAGKSGSLEIKIQIRENEDCPKEFFENYLLQATVVLDKEKCSNIVAEGATAGNVGRNRQLLYNIIAGNEKDITISAQVHDFEMEGISFQGVPMSFDIDRDSIDDSKITDKTKGLTDSVQKLDDGAGDLKEGTEEVADGGTKLKQGISTFANRVSVLQKGGNSLSAGGSSLQSGGQELQAGLNQYVAGTESLVSGVKQYMGGTGKLAEGAKQLKPLENLSQVNKSITGLYQVVAEGNAQEGTPSLQAGASNLTKGLQTIQEQVQKLAGSTDAEQLQKLMKALNQVQTTAGQLSTSAQKVSDVIQTSKTIIGQIESYHQSVMDSLQNQTDKVNKTIAQSGGKLAAQVNGQVDGINQEIIKSVEGTNSQIDSAIAAVQSAVDSGSLDEETAQQVIANMEDSKVEELTVGYVDTPSISASVQMPKEDAQIQKSIEQLNAMSGNLTTAAENFQTASKQLKQIAENIPMIKGNASIEKLSESITAAYNGAVGLQKGIDGVGNALNQLKTSTASFSDAGKGVSSLIAGFEELQKNDPALLEGTKTLSDSGKTLTAGADSLYSGIRKLNGGIGSFSSGLSSLNQGADSLNTNMGTLTNGLESLEKATGELKEGTGKLREKTSNIDEQIETEIDDMLQEISGSDFEPVSFASKKNTEVGLVQFAIKTEGIKLPEIEEPEVEQKKETIWDKIKELF